jgi:transcriptional regulator with XRE-family HTH domain
MTTDMSVLSNKLRVWRLDHGLTLEEMADLVGLNVGYLSRVERGERRLSPLAKVKVARRLGVSIRELFEPEPIDEVEATA